MTMLGFRIDAFELHAGIVELLELLLQHPLGHLVRSVSMSWSPSISTSGSTIGTRPPVLADGGVAGERLGIGVDAVVARDLAAPMSITARHLANSAPSSAYSSTRSRQAVEAFGHRFARAEGQGLRRPCRA